MRQARTLSIGWDVHNDAMAVASVANDLDAAVVFVGSVGTRHGDLDHLLRTMPAKAQQLLFVSAAGPCGDWLSRYLSNKGYDCWVVAPSLLPQKPGDRVNTDRRDAVPWARLARSGDLTAVYGPNVDAAASRARTRAREDAISARTDAKWRLKAFLLRHELRDSGQATGGAAHRRWLSEGVCPTPAQPIVVQAYVRAVTDHSERLQRLAQARQEHVQAWRLSPVVEALQAWRGVQLTVAVTWVADMGDLPRVESPRPRLKCLGLMPAAPSSGEQRRQGAMTKAGHPHARRVLVEGAWASRSPAKRSRHWQRRLARHPTVIQDSSWKAHVRRCTRYRRLVARGNHAHGVTVAMARELTGFRWAMATQVPIIACDQDGS